MHDAQQMRGLRGSFCTKSVADPRVILSRRPCATPLTRSRRFAPSPTSPRRERGEVKRTRLTRSRTDSPVKQPRPAKREILPPPTRRPYRARGAKRVDRFSPSTMRGMTRRKAQLGRSRVSLRLAKALAVRASPFGAPSRLFCSRDRASGYWAGLMKVLRSGQAFACLHPHPSSRFRQSP